MVSGSISISAGTSGINYWQLIIGFSRVQRYSPYIVKELNNNINPAKHNN